MDESRIKVREEEKSSPQWGERDLVHWTESWVASSSVVAGLFVCRPLLC
jgi:hypothetical protein